MHFISSLDFCTPQVSRMSVAQTEQEELKCTIKCISLILMVRSKS